MTVAIEQIEPRTDQPRRRFEDGGLDELAASIREKGVLSPILVRRAGKGYGLIAGERRWRAAQRAGLKTVPVLVEDVDDDDAFEMALVENIQREDLNPIEEAEAFQRLLKGKGFSQGELAERVGKDRSTIANALRLLRLPESVRSGVVDGGLSMGHARALVSLDNEKDIEMAAREVLTKRLSVRQAEGLVRRFKGGSHSGKKSPAQGKDKISPEVRDLVARLERSLATRCRLDHTKGRGGKLTIEYQSLDDLDRIVARLLGT